MSEPKDTDTTTLGTFARRQFTQQWGMALAGARESLRKLAALVAMEQGTMDRGEVPNTDLLAEAAKYAGWQAKLALLDHLAAQLHADGAVLVLDRAPVQRRPGVK